MSHLKESPAVISLTPFFFFNPVVSSRGGFFQSLHRAVAGHWGCRQFRVPCWGCRQFRVPCWGSGSQCQMSEAEPFLVMALSGLRDRELLFFQRTLPQPSGCMELLGLVVVLCISSPSFTLSFSEVRVPVLPPNTTSPSPCQSLSALWKECARQAVMSRARSARLHQNTRQCSCCP